MEEIRISRGVQEDLYYTVRVEPTCPAFLSMFSRQDFPDMVEYFRGDCMRLRLRRELHSFRKLLKLGWPEECKDLLLNIWVFYIDDSTNGCRLAEIKDWMAWSSAPCYLVWEVQHEAMKLCTPVLAQVRHLVANHFAGWVNSTAGALAAHKYLPVLVRYLRLRLQCLERHCAMCDRNLQGTGAWFPSLCKSIECMMAMNAPLTLYLHPTTASLLISLVQSALSAPAFRRRLMFGDSLTLNEGYWLHGVLDADAGPYGYEPNWQKIREELLKAPNFDCLAFFASGNPPFMANASSPQLFWSSLPPGDPVLLRLLNWIVLTFDGVLLPLGQKYMPWLPWWHDIFIVRAGNRERAAAFRHRKAAARGRSFFAFHGSHICNWHSILRQDLQNLSCTPLEINGTASGPGVYVCKDWFLAAVYSRWYAYGFSCLGLCEVVDTERVDRTPGNGICVVKDEQDVTVRALLVKGASFWDLNSITFPDRMGNGHALATRLGNFLMETKEYQELCEGPVDGEDVSHSSCYMASAMRPTR